MSETPLDFPAFVLALSQERHPLHLSVALFDWDPNEHPRGLLGRFVETLLKSDHVQLPDGTKVDYVERPSETGADQPFGYRVTTRDGQVHELPRTPSSNAEEDAAKFALDASARHTDPDSLGTGIPHESYVSAQKHETRKAKTAAARQPTLFEALPDGEPAKSVLNTLERMGEGDYITVGEGVVMKHDGSSGFGVSYPDDGEMTIDTIGTDAHGAINSLRDLGYVADQDFSNRTSPASRAAQKAGFPAEPTSGAERAAAKAAEQATPEQLAVIDKAAKTDLTGELEIFADRLRNGKAGFDELGYMQNSTHMVLQDVPNLDPETKKAYKELRSALRDIGNKWTGDKHGDDVTGWPSSKPGIDYKGKPPAPYRG